MIVYTNSFFNNRTIKFAFTPAPLEGAEARPCIDLANAPCIQYGYLPLQFGGDPVDKLNGLRLF